VILRSALLDGIRDGTITLAFRRWRRPTVRSGGTLLTAAGQLSITHVAPVNRGAITAADARRAGYDSLDMLLRELDSVAEGELYKIEFGALRPDPRVALREQPPDGDDIAVLRRKLERLDAGPYGAWTQQALALIASHPGVRAADLCGHVNQPRDDFKTNVRKLKALGLTESLEVGYRLSPRGRTLLEALGTDTRSAARTDPGRSSH
jgi:hypothetical protein